MAYKTDAEIQAIACKDDEARVAVEGVTERDHPAAANDNAPERERKLWTVNKQDLREALDRDLGRVGDWMQTFSGRSVYPLDLRPSDIDIRDIAHSLSMQCRYAGHSLSFYSVAEHSVHVARWCRKFGADVALEGLMHDASEAYLVDVPRPVKPFLAGYKEVEAAAQAVIGKRFGLFLDFPQAVHEADNRILNDERAQNMSVCAKAWSLPDPRPLGVTLQFWSPERAEREFLALFDELYGGD